MNDFKKRYRFLIAGIFIAIVILIFRAYELAFHSPVPLSMLPQKPLIKRGTIFDANDHELAVSRGSISIGIRPDGIVNAEKTARALSNALKLEYEFVLNKINTSANYFYLEKNVSISDVKDLQSLKLSGVAFEEKISRYYPNDNLASTVLGFTGIDNEGLAGIEYEYNDNLTASNNNEYIGDDIHLTINAYIQHQLEKALQQGLAKSRSKAAIGIISEVHTGKILAMASLPDFNPNHPTDFPSDAKRNRAISENIEPGSTFKVFILAALMKDHMLKEDATFFCPGYFQYKKYRLNCSSVHNKENLTDAIKNSCNTAIIQAAWNMPVIRLYEHLKQFGFTNKTMINLPGEEDGRIPQPEKWDIDLKMAIPIGQGLSVTPIQLTTAANSIANGGIMYKPILVNKIMSANGETLKSTKIENKYMTISPEISKKLLTYLQHVVMKGGTGYLASIPDFQIAGKTSTTMKSDNTGYPKGKYQASFIGFFPGDNPEISIFIWYDEPQGGVYQGGQVAAPIFKNILLDIIPIVHKGKIRETGNLTALNKSNDVYNKNIMPNLLNKSKKEVLFILWSHFPGEHDITGKGYLVNQSPPAGSKIGEPYKFSLKFSEND
ncbi:MAG: penicillin-binding transpeptidase domain-containing protein [Spirochaetia bacterium]|nr:penicillin-binding transpeptidase domain-containing protein [Spirochaetia bacterium]